MTTLSEWRKRKGEEPIKETHEGVHEEKHPSALEYAQIGVVLAIVTAIEVSLYYVERGGHLGHTILVIMLMFLTVIKFALVVLWFMHLKFDHRLFSTMFVAGFLLAISIFVVVMATMGGSLV